MKEAGRTQVSSRNSLQWLQVGAQVAPSVTLLAAAGLLVRSFHELSRVDPGFEPSRVLTFRVSATWAETGNRERLVQRIDGTLEELRALPGVEAAATAVMLPGVPASYESSFELVEAPSAIEAPLVAESRLVSPQYFATMRIPLLAGGACRNATRESRDLLVNRAFSTRYLSGWPSAIGLHLTSGKPPSRPDRIVGIVGDARERGLARDPGPIVYSCFSAPNPMRIFLSVLAASRSRSHSRCA